MNSSKRKSLDQGFNAAAMPHELWSFPAMFYLSLLFLALLSALIVLWIDVAQILDVAENNAADIATSALDSATDGSRIETESELLEHEIATQGRIAYHGGLLCAILLLVLWGIFILEQVFNGLLVSEGTSYWQRYPHGWTCCLLPPLRMCMRHHTDVDRVWLPKWGWQVADRDLQRHLERAFSIPMIWIALLILPIFGIQLYYKGSIVEYPAMQAIMHFGTGIIWFAFATEFIIMVSVSNKKLAYCKQHWLDLLIILLPIVYFLRSARLLRATKLAKIGKLQQLSRVARVYRLRGVAMRALRALMLLEVVHRLLRTKPEKRIAKLEEQYEEKERELADLRAEIEQLRQSLNAPPVTNSEPNPPGTG
ncbi:MAG: hypothetical protein KDB22_24840 [Planctomycetales bacterium]|nr:hypothetical protein [Planctomycetales bacterium]